MDMIFTVMPNPDGRLMAEDRQYIMKRQQVGSRQAMQWTMSLKDLKQLAAALDEFIENEEAVRCVHCDEPLAPSLQVHQRGQYPGLARCAPALSKLPYGYNAHPIGTPCEAPCLGSKA